MAKADAKVKSEDGKKGFAAMDPEKLREVARLGGLAAHRAGTAHTFTPEEARNAGKKGGRAPHVSRGRRPRRGGGEPAAT